MRLRHRREMRTRALSPMLTDRRSHRRASLVTGSNREKREVRNTGSLSPTRDRPPPATRERRSDAAGDQRARGRTSERREKKKEFEIFFFLGIYFENMY